MTSRADCPCVLLLEPHIALRRALGELLSGEKYRVIECESLEQVIHHASSGDGCQVALVAWQSMEGMLADEHRHHLVQLTNRLHLVLMVPRRWKRLLEQSDLDFVTMVAKPFDADELLGALHAAGSSPRLATSGR